MSERTERFRAVNLGETIKGQGRTKRWVAGRVGIHETLLAHFIAGRRTVPMATASKISSELGVPFYLLFESASADNVQAQEVSAA